MIRYNNQQYCKKTIIFGGFSNMAIWRKTNLMISNTGLSKNWFVFIWGLNSLCRIKITVTAVTVIKTWRLPVTVRVVTCGFSLINAYMCVVANVYWVMTYVTLTVIFYMTYWCSGTTQNWKKLLCQDNRNVLLSKKSDNRNVKVR